jgi:hypothetical protein
VPCACRSPYPARAPSSAAVGFSPHASVAEMTSCRAFFF